MRSITSPLFSMTARTKEKDSHLTVHLSIPRYRRSPQPREQKLPKNLWPKRVALPVVTHLVLLAKTRATDRRAVAVLAQVTCSVRQIRIKNSNNNNPVGMWVRVPSPAKPIHLAIIAPKSPARTQLARAVSKHHTRLAKRKINSKRTKTQPEGAASVKATSSDRQQRNIKYLYSQKAALLPAPAASVRVMPSDKLLRRQRNRCRARAASRRATSSARRKNKWASPTPARAALIRVTSLTRLLLTPRSQKRTHSNRRVPLGPITFLDWQPPTRMTIKKKRMTAIKNNY